MKNFLERLKLSLPSAQQSLKEEMSVQQVHVRSDKKGEVVLNDGTFASIYKTKLGHIALAQHTNEYIKIAFLWDMRELWKKSEELHRKIAFELID